MLALKLIIFAILVTQVFSSADYKDGSPDCDWLHYVLRKFSKRCRRETKTADLWMGRTGRALVDSGVSIENIYYLSYMWIGPLGILSTIFVGYVVSLITGPNKPGDVDPRYLMPFSNSMLVFLPARLKNWISSLGPQFIKEEYKSKFLDPANKFSVRESEMIVLSDIGDNSVELLDKQEKGENGTSVPTISVTDGKDDSIANSNGGT